MPLLPSIPTYNIASSRRFISPMSVASQTRALRTHRQEGSQSSTSESSVYNNSSDDDDDKHPILTNSSSLAEQLLADDGIINIADKAQLLPQAKEDPTFTVLRYLGLNKNALPRIPTGERLHELLRLDADIWGMSSLERKRLHQAWCQELKEIHSQTFADDLYDSGTHILWQQNALARQRKRYE